MALILIIDDSPTEVHVMQKALEKEKGGSVGDREMEEFKTIVTEVLTPHASAILLDPEWGLPAGKRRAKNSNSRRNRRPVPYNASSACTMSCRYYGPPLRWLGVMTLG